MSSSVLKVIAAMVGKHMPSPGNPQFTRSVFMLDVGLQFSSRVGRVDIPGGSVQLFLCLNLNLSQEFFIMMLLCCERHCS